MKADRTHPAGCVPRQQLLLVLWGAGHLAPYHLVLQAKPQALRGETEESTGWPSWLLRPLSLPGLLLWTLLQVCGADAWAVLDADFYQCFEVGSGLGAPGFPELQSAGLSE